MMKSITQTDLGKALGISRAHISNLERGGFSTSLENAIKISAYLEFSLDGLFADKLPVKNSKESRRKAKIARLERELKCLKETKSNNNPTKNEERG